MWEYLAVLLKDANTQWVLLGTLILGLASGVIGSFALLRKQSLLGDAMAHAALPGVCLAFLLSGEKSILLFLIGAALTGLLATYCIQVFVKHSRIKEDTSIGLVLSVFFGFGIVLLTKVSQSQYGNKSGLDDFIFGQAASLIGTDLKVITTIAVILVVVTTILFKELKLLTFDPQFAQGIGLPTKFLNMLLMTLIVGAVVIGIQAVGVVLMSAMLITPALTARYWTERLERMVIIAGIIGALSGILGTLLSALGRGLATGPLIVIAATLIFLFSLLFGPRRGLIMKGVKHYQFRKTIVKENVLQTLYELMEAAKKCNGKERYTFSLGDITAKRTISKFMLKRIMRDLRAKNLICKDKGGSYWLTSNGIQTAYDITLNNRLCEIYMMYEMEFDQLDVNNADYRFQIQKLPNHILLDLQKLLKSHGREPLVIPTGNQEISYEKITMKR